ncbi:MAG: energy transducer TonB [Bacteroidetes bacterium]|nr:energy transducer TonB [Bacteroidota bacterium]
MKTQPLFSQSWSEVTGSERNEIVFERLNKTYGAYEIRTHYDQTLLKAFAGAGLFIILLSAAMLFSRAIPIPETKIPSNDSTIFKALEKEKIIQINNPTSNPPKTNYKDLAPVIAKDSAIKEDTTQLLALNPNHSDGKSKDTSDINIDHPISGGGGKIVDEDTTTHDVWGIEEMPRFPGGDDELYHFLRNNLHIPEDVKSYGNINEKVGVVFVIDKEGQITDIVLHKNGCKYSQLNNEATRVVKKMPQWEPGRQNGKPVKVRMILPVRFVSK